MNSPDDPHKKLQRREQELQERERAIRLRELEAEINEQQPPLYKTRKHQPKNALQQWSKKLVFAAKFFTLVVIAIITVQIASWLAKALVVGLIAFIGYKFFLEEKSDKSNRK